MRGIGRAAQRTVTAKLLRIISGVPAAVLFCLILRAPLLADNSVTIGLYVVVVDTNSTTPPPPDYISAPPEVASLDYMTIPVTLDGQGQTIDGATIFYDTQTTPGVSGGAPRLLAPIITASNFGQFVSTGTSSPPLVAGNYYYKGNIIVPAVAYRNGGVNYFMRVDLHDGTHKYVGLNGGVMVDSDDPIGLTPFSTTFNPRPMATVTSTGGVVALADGGPAGSATRVTFPDGAVSGNSAVYIEQLDPADTARVPRPNGMSAPVAAYDFDGSVRRFNKPIELTLRYLDVTGGPNGTPDGVVDGTTIDAGTLRVFWWDGFVWRLVGGEVDLVHHAVTAKTAHFSVYALFPTTGAPPAAAAYRPLEKVFTPNGDGKNDSVKFSGLLSTTGFEIRIFDATGRRVRTINDIDVWDGKDDNGKTVENGAYVYQFRADNSSDWISGMIGVAK